jgi:hypothetical protein
MCQALCECPDCLSLNDNGLISKSKNIRVQVIMCLSLLLYVNIFYYYSARSVCLRMLAFSLVSRRALDSKRGRYRSLMEMCPVIRRGQILAS